jgi:hypothetical protein
MRSLAGKELFSKSSSADILGFETEQKCALINAFWPHLNLTIDDYFEGEYVALLNFWGQTLQNLHPFKHEFATQGWDGMLAIITELSSGRDTKRPALSDVIKKKYRYTTDEAIACSIELAVRLWIGVNVRSEGLFVGESAIRWQNDQSLNDFIRTPFEKRKGKAQSSQYLLFDGSFTAVGLKDICRLEIIWTDNLLDHLKLQGPRGARQLSIYKHKICLVNHRKEPGPGPMLFPEELLNETIRTLDLLFPGSDDPTVAFLKEEKVQMWIENPFDMPQATELDEFNYWKGRLAQLLGLFYGPPETVRQTLLDTRNTAQFATIWVAIFGVVFLTVLFGVLSTVYSAKQYYLAVDAYKLALAQACQQTSPPLPGFCT